MSDRQPAPHDDTLDRLDRGDAVRALRIGVFATLVIVVAGAAAVPLVARNWLRYVSLFYEQFADMETPAFVVVAMFSLIVWRALRQPASFDDAPAPTGETWPAKWKPFVAGIALVTAILCVAGTIVVFHRYFQADDEYSAWFQAVIYAHGHRQAVVPAEWCAWITAMTPNSIAPVGCTWHLNFLPIHSLVRSVFIALNADIMAGPVTAALSVLLVASIVRRIWPDRPQRAWVAVLLFATSTQFLFMSMTMWSMPTHLLVGLLWLRLYVEDRPWSIALLPIVGFIALGVHSPIPHGLWVAVFLLRYWRDRRWGWAAYTTVGYVIAVAYWSRFFGYGAPAAALSATSLTAVTGGALSAVNGVTQAMRAPFHMPTRLHGQTTAMHISLIASWSAPITLLLMIATIAAWKSLDNFARDMALSLLLIIAARVFVITPQGEGWGYRYIYDALGNIALLAACGSDILVRAVGSVTARRLVVYACSASLIVLAPLRAVQIELHIAPEARAVAWMQSLPEKVIVFPWNQYQWGRQMLRNDPFLREYPVMMGKLELGKTGIAELQRRFPGQVRVLGPEDLKPFGLHRAPMRLGHLLVLPD